MLKFFDLLDIEHIQQRNASGQFGSVLAKFRTVVGERDEFSIVAEWLTYSVNPQPRPHNATAFPLTRVEQNKKQCITKSNLAERVFGKVA